MHFLLIAIAAVGVNAGIPADLVPRQCSRVRVRKEVSQMSSDEWDRFVRVYLSLQRLPPPDGHPDLRSEWDWWTSVHVDSAMPNHGTASFLPWHRIYTLALARRLEQLDEQVVLPWWDFSRNWQRPLQSPLISQQSLGLTVSPGAPGDCRYRRSLYEGHCLMRDYEPQSFTTWYSTAVIDWIVENNTGDYDGFRRALESGPHNLVHSSLGGVVGDFSQMISPNDPLFFPFHAGVDYIWWRWQQNSANARAYGGPRMAGMANMAGMDANVNDELAPFGINVAQSLDTNALCYTYADPPVDRPRVLLELSRVQLPEPVPDWYLQRHGYNATEVRRVEEKLCSIMKGF